MRGQPARGPSLYEVGMTEVVWGHPVATGKIDKAEFDAAGKIRVLVEGSWWTLANPHPFSFVDVYTVYQGDFGCYLVLKVPKVIQSNLITPGPMTLEGLKTVTSPSVTYELFLGEPVIGPVDDTDTIQWTVKTEAVRVDVVFCLAVGACDLYRVRGMVMEGRIPKKILYEGPWGSREKAEAELEEWRTGARSL